MYDYRFRIDHTKINMHIESILNFLAAQQKVLAPDDELTRVLQSLGIEMDCELDENDLSMVQAAVKQHETNDGFPEKNRK